MKEQKRHIILTKVKTRILLLFHLSLCLLLLSACSMTKGLPEDEQLYAGLKKIVYSDDKEYTNEAYNDHLSDTKNEIEAALATPPNGSLFGSSYYAKPWSWRLWVYNHYANKTSGFAKWMTKTFGKPPILISQVNPTLHANIARSVLHNNGYFRGDVTYEIIPQKNPKKSKIAYTVHLDTIYTVDSVQYTNFPSHMQVYIDSTREERLIKAGRPFSLSSLENERSRINRLMRNNGYYFYNTNYASYLADTFAVSNKTQLRFQLADELPPGTCKKWYIGNMNVNFRKTAREELKDSVRRNHLIIHYNGKKPPVRPAVILKDLQLRPRQVFSLDRFQESANLINSNGLFSSTDFQFTPRQDSDTLDLNLNLVFDKPWDFYIEGTFIGRTNSRFGPQAKIGVTKRNAFRAGEKLDINLHGAYEFSWNGDANMSNYQLGADVAIEFPRLLVPFYNPYRIRRDKNGRVIRRRRFYTTPSTLAKISYDVVRRPQYYMMHVASGEWTYRWQPTESHRHEFSPLAVNYQFKSSQTEAFDEIIGNNLYLHRSMEDYFIPKMRYTYTYKSPSTKRNPIRWETTFDEAGLLISLVDVARGKSFTQKQKELLSNPYAQFLRVETDLSKTWALGETSSLTAHANAGFIFTYGNSDEAPFTEEFYAGGANSIRAFSVRGVGPGRFSDYGFKDKQLSYLLRNGDMKLVANLEYRTRLFGNLKGAVFLDAGNIWRMKEFTIGFTEEEKATLPEEDLFLVNFLEEWMANTTFKPSHFFRDIAIGTGIGLRYDLGFLVVRLDWGFVIHDPGYNGISRYFFNVDSFKDLQTLHFAIGYPF